MTVRPCSLRFFSQTTSLMRIWGSLLHFARLSLRCVAQLILRLHLRRNSFPIVFIAQSWHAKIGITNFSLQALPSLRLLLISSFLWQKLGMLLRVHNTSFSSHIVVAAYRHETISGRFWNTSPARILRTALLFDSLRNLAQTGLLLGESVQMLIFNFLVWQVTLLRTCVYTLLLDIWLGIMLILAFTRAHNCRVEPLIYGLVVHGGFVVLERRPRIFICANRIETQLLLRLYIQQIYV